MPVKIIKRNISRIVTCQHLYEICIAEWYTHAVIRYVVITIIISLNSITAIITSELIVYIDVTD
jgi:hypothetical protein